MSVNDFFNGVEVISKFNDGVTTSYIRIYYVVREVRMDDGTLRTSREYHLSKDSAESAFEVLSSLPSVESCYIETTILFL